MMKRLFSLLVALLLVAGAAPVSWAALADLGIPIAPHGYPAWYSDSNGLQLELCVPPPAGNASRPDLCIGDPLELNPDGTAVNPLVITGESFWWLAETSIALPGGGDAMVLLGVEGTFGGSEAPIDGNQISFGRTRIRIDTPVAGTYTVTHPYATQVFEVVDPAEGINYTADIGAANFLSPAIGFRGTLAAPIGPFLTWPDYQNDPSLQVRALDPVTQLPTGPVLEQYIGNPNVASPVVNGPHGNIFRVQGPNGLDVQTNLFFVMGKVFDPTVQSVAHVYPNGPVQKLLELGPVNRVEFFANPDPAAPLVTVTGVDHIYPVGYPLWYQENLGTAETPIPGLQLTLCVPGDAMCISDPIDPASAIQNTLRTGGEAFWWSADARFDIGDGRASLTLGLEATFAGTGAVADGQQIAFGRERIRIDTPEAGTYRVTHPYGQRIFENVAAGDKGINFTSDIGITDPADPDSAMVGALYSDIGPTFLRWATFNEDPELTDDLLVTPHASSTPETPLYNYYVGNPGVERPVVGSPLGTNFFRVERLVGGTVEDGTWDLVGETTLFAVSGKVFDPATFEFPVNTAADKANPDFATLNLAQAPSVTIDILANDTPAPGATPTINILPAGGAFGPDNGTVVIANAAAGTVTYTPSAAFAATGGVDTFAYNFLDSTGVASNNAIVTVTVTPAETIVFSQARFDLRRLRLDLRGTSNFEGSTLSFYPGDAATGTPLGTAVVRNGRWSFRGTATSNLTQVTVKSNSAGATTVTQPLQVR